MNDFRQKIEWSDSMTENNDFTEEKGGATARRWLFQGQEYPNLYGFRMAVLRHLAESGKLVNGRLV